MEFAEALPKQIGNVKLNYEFYPGEDIYSDGEIEDADSLSFVLSSGKYRRLAADYEGYEGA